MERTESGAKVFCEYGSMAGDQRMGAEEVWPDDFMADLNKIASYLCGI